MKKTFILLFFLLSSSVFAQKAKIDSKISHEIKVLKENNINSFYVLEKYCVGCVLGKPEIYVFWKDNEGSFFKKIDESNSQKIKIPEDIFNNHFEKSHRIRNEKVKPYQTGKNSFVSNAHGFFSKYYFIVDGKLEARLINYFDLTTENKKPNINFKYNNSLMLIQLDKLCDEIIRKNK